MSECTIKDKLGVSLISLSGKSFLDAINWIKEKDLKNIEIMGFEGIKLYGRKVPGIWYNNLTMEKEKVLSKKFEDIEGIAVHAPFVDLPLFSYNQRIEQQALIQIKESIDLCSFLLQERKKSGIVTLHINTENYSYNLEESWRKIIAVFRELGDYAYNKNVLLGIETFFPDDKDTYIKLIREIEHPAVGSTLDVGHGKFYFTKPQLSSSDIKIHYRKLLSDIINSLKEKVFHVHLHDFLPPWDDHIALGEGIIDIEKSFEDLFAIRYNGFFSLEIVQAEAGVGALEKSIDYCNKIDVNDSTVKRLY